MTHNEYFSTITRCAPMLWMLQTSISVFGINSTSKIRIGFHNFLLKHILLCSAPLFGQIYSPPPNCFSYSLVDRDLCPIQNELQDRKGQDRKRIKKRGIRSSKCLLCPLCFIPMSISLRGRGKDRDRHKEMHKHTGTSVLMDTEFLPWNA